VQQVHGNLNSDMLINPKTLEAKGHSGGNVRFSRSQREHAVRYTPVFQQLGLFLAQHSGRLQVLVQHLALGLLHLTLQFSSCLGRLAPPCLPFIPCPV